MNASNQIRKRISKKERNDLRLEQAMRRKWRKRAIGFGSAALLFIGIALFVFMFQKSLPGEPIEVMEDQTHIADVNSPHTPYNSDPPTSGPHLDYIAHWGVHKEPLPKELLVHNLEDGGVVIYYNSKTDEETVKQIEDIVNRYKEFVLVNPNPEMENRLTLTAWGRMEKLDGVDEERIVQFIEAYKGIDRHRY